METTYSNQVIKNHSGKDVSLSSQQFAEGRVRSVQNKIVYLDYQATTPLDPRVLAAMMPHLTERFGNPHSVNHALGRDAADSVAAARAAVAAAVGALPEDIVFTSGATEANNLALQGLANAPWRTRPRLVSIETEHKSVLEPLELLASRGFEVELLPVGADGLLDLAILERSLKQGPAIVSVMAANSELGVLQPVGAIGALCRRFDAVFHSDASQAVGKIQLDVEEYSIDVMTFSGHKMYGPKGIGALVAGQHLRRRMSPLIVGGGQQDGLRAGTLPTFLCVGLGEACTIALREMGAEAANLAALRNKLLDSLRSQAGVELNGSLVQRLPGNLNIRMPGVDALAVIAAAPELAISTGSACASGGSSIAPSHVLRAIGLNDCEVRSSVRVSLGRFTTEADMDRAADLLAAAILSVRRSAA